MALERRTIGRLPVSRGNWNSSDTYYKYNIVTNNGSTFMSISDNDISGSSYEPSVEIVGGQYVIKYGTTVQDGTNDVWQLMSYGGDAVEIANQIANKADGEYNSELGYVVANRATEADDLVGSSSDRVAETWRGIIRTTAGDVSIRSDANSAMLTSIQGILDANDNPFTGVQFAWNPFNLLRLGQTIQISGTTYYWIKVPELVCTNNTLGTTDANNGIMVTAKVGDNDPFDCGSTNVAVKWTAEKPTTSSSPSNAGVVTDGNGRRHYTCSEGYILIQVLTGVTAAQLCVHISWSGKDDMKWIAAASSTPSTIDFTTARNSIHNGIGMYGIYNADQGKGVYDEIVLGAVAAAGKWYRRVERTKLVWTLGADETVEEGGVTVTYHTATCALSGMAVGGIWQANLILANLATMVDQYTTFNVDAENKIITLRFQITRTKAQLDSAFDNYWFYYELATVAEGTHSIIGVGTPDDMSTEEYTEGTGTIIGSVISTTSYIQGLKDYLRSLPNELSTIERVLAEHIVALRTDLDHLHERFHQSLGDLTINSANMMDYPKWQDYPWFIFTTDVPAVNPQFVGQICIDTTNKIAYIGCGISATTDWKRITNA